MDTWAAVICRPCCRRPAIFKQPGLLNLHSRVAPSCVSQIFTPNSGKGMQRLSGKHAECCRSDSVQAPVIISQWLGDLIRSRNLDSFIHRTGLMSPVISLSTPNLFLCPDIWDLRTRRVNVKSPGLAGLDIKLTAWLMVIFLSGRDGPNMAQYWHPLSGQLWILNLTGRLTAQLGQPVFRSVWRDQKNLWIEDLLIFLCSQSFNRISAFPLYYQRKQIDSYTRCVCIIGFNSYCLWISILAWAILDLTKTE